MDRQYTEIVLKRTEKKVKMKAYLTVKESRELNKSIMGINFDGKGFDEVVLFESLLFRAFVVSIDGNTENLFDSMEEFPDSDYRQIIEEATRLKNDGIEKKSS